MVEQELLLNMAQLLNCHALFIQPGMVVDWLKGLEQVGLGAGYALVASHTLPF